MPSDYENGAKKTIDISIKAEKMTADVLKSALQDALTIYRNQESEFSWMPKPPKGNVGVLSSIKSTGAGQVRSSGCFIARYNHIDIEASIYQAINRISAPLPPESRYQLGRRRYRSWRRSWMASAIHRQSRPRR